VEEIITRPRHTRGRMPPGRRRKSYNEPGKLAVTIARQIILTMIIMGFIGFIKNVNSKPTNYMYGKLHAALTQNVEPEQIYKSLNGFISRLTGKNSDQKSNATDLEKGTSDDFSKYAKDTGSNLEDNEYNKNGRDSSFGVVAGISRIDYIDTLSFLPPVEGYVSVPFGQIMGTDGQMVEVHYGVDIEAEKGASVIASESGYVKETGSNPEYGNFVKIAHSDDVETLYAHCSKVLVSVGEKVDKGDIIAKAGDLNSPVGAHLHFEIRKGGKAVDPAFYMDFDKLTR